MNLLDNLYESKNSRKTKDGLPKITQETLDSMMEEMSKNVALGKSMQSKIEEWAKEVESENPVLFCYFQHIIIQDPPDLQETSFARFIVIYHVLKSQTINDNLSFSKRIFDYYEKADK